MNGNPETAAHIDAEDSPVPLTELERQGSQLMENAQELPLQYTNTPEYSQKLLEPPGEAECPQTPKSQRGIDLEDIELPIDNETAFMRFTKFCNVFSCRSCQ